MIENWLFNVLEQAYLEGFYNNIDQVIKHPNYTTVPPTHAIHDIALVKVAREMHSTKNESILYLSAACLPIDDNLNFPTTFNEYLSIIGHGYTGLVYFNEQFQIDGKIPERHLHIGWVMDLDNATRCENVTTAICTHRIPEWVRLFCIFGRTLNVMLFI